MRSQPNLASRLEVVSIWCQWPTDWDVKPAFHIHVYVESQWMPVGCINYPAADSNVIVN